MKPTITCLAYRPAVCTDRSTTVQLLVRLSAPKVEHRRRPSLNVGLCLDRSGSMGGPPIERAKEAAVHLVEQLHSSDQVSVVVFDHGVDVLTPCREVGNRASIVQRICSVEANGGTDLHRGWLESCHQVESGATPRRLNRVILLSDGATNTGCTDPARIESEVSDWRQKGISTTTVGLGLHYNEDLLARMSDAGNGNFYHVRDPQDIAPYFALELQGLSRTYGREVTLGVEALGGVELLRIINPLERAPNGRIKVADLVHSAPIEIVLELLVPALERSQDLCRVRLDWTEVDTDEPHSLEAAFRLPVVPQGQLSEFPVFPEVLQKRALQLAGKILKKAVQAIDRKDYERAKTRLKTGLGALAEAEPSPELEEMETRLRHMLHELERGSYNSVRKEATYSSVSMNRSIVPPSPFLKKFLELPLEQRTTEKFQELMAQYPLES